MSRIAKRDVSEALAAGTDRRPRMALGGSVAACIVMAFTLTLACGAFAAGEKSVKESGSALALQLNPADIAGRWTGTHTSYGAARANCGGKPCTLTLDISACDDGWCGIKVADDGTCGGRALAVKTSEGKATWQHFEGRLEIEPKAASYVIQATLWKDEAEARAGNLDVVGDTGTELLFMRRSFPFQAHLARTGDAVCTVVKATS